MVCSLSDVLSCTRVFFCNELTITKNVHTMVSMKNWPTFSRLDTIEIEKCNIVKFVKFCTYFEDENNCKIIFSDGIDLIDYFVALY